MTSSPGLSIPSPNETCFSLSNFGNPVFSFAEKDLVGQGGFAKVYRAKCIYPNNSSVFVEGSSVAVKILNYNVIDQDGIIAFNKFLSQRKPLFFFDSDLFTPWNEFKEKCEEYAEDLFQHLFQFYLFGRYKKQDPDKVRLNELKSVCHLTRAFLGSCSEFKGNRPDILSSLEAKLIEKARAITTYFCMMRNMEYMEGEIRCMEKLEHRNIVRFYQSGMIENAFFYAMEFVEGQTLLEYINMHDGLDELRARHIAECIGEALKCIQKMGYSHRDLKPENIFCRRNSENKLEVKVGDFGLCKKTGDVLTTIVGTGPYTAPEVFINRGHYDQKCDVWSFACIIFVMLTGSIPFSPSVVNCSPNYDLTRLLSLVRVSTYASDLLDGMFQKNPEKRLSVNDVLNSDWIQKKSSPPSKETCFALLRDRYEHKGFEFSDIWDSGPSSHTFLMKDRKSQKCFCIKALFKCENSEKDKESVANLWHLREVVNKKELDGRVPKVFDICECGEMYFLVTEFVHGTPLNDMVNKRDFLDKIRDHREELFSELVNTVLLLHRANIFGVNLSLKNIIIEEKEPGHYFPVLTDCYMSRLRCFETIDHSSSPLHFVAPEMIQSSSVPLHYWGTEESDVWSLGCILYTFYVGTEPFKGKTTQDWYINLIRPDYNPFEKIPADCPEYFRLLIQDLLNKDPNDRLAAFRKFLLKNCFY